MPFTTISYLVNISLAGHKVSVCHRDGPESVAGHGFDDLSHEPLLHVPRELLQATLVSVDECASEEGWWVSLN